MEFLTVQLNAKQIEWLFIKGNFPYNEDKIKEWQKLKSNFEIIVNRITSKPLNSSGFFCGKNRLAKDY